MRVSTAYSYETTIATLQRRQSELSQAQEQMTSGKRVAKPSDDPAGIARAERALAEEGRGKTLQRGVDASRNSMTLTESGLGDAIDLTQTAREALVEAGNASYSSSERAALATKLRQLRSQLLAVANQTDGAGGYLFGGQGAKATPFADGLDASGNPAVTTSSSGGQSNASSSEDLPLTVDGQAVWMQAYSGNGSFESGAAAANTGNAWIAAGAVTDPSALTGNDYAVQFSVDAAGVTTYSVTQGGAGTALSNVPYVSGTSIAIDGMKFAISGTPANGDQFDIVPSQPSLSVFSAIDKTLVTLENTNANGGQVQQAVNSGLRDLDQVLGKFQSARAMVGETLNRLDTVESRTGARILAARTTRSNAEDLDMVQAASEFSNKQTSYQAALQSYAMVQKLSLFQYVNG
ncbi:MAG: flagellar hook-associated protein FlgL [Burkholderiales bacterium]